MSKNKIFNGKFLIAFSVFALLACLIPFGFQAFATDEASDMAAPAVEPGEANAPTNATIFKVPVANYVYTLDNLHEFDLTDGDQVKSDEVTDHVGYLSILHADGTKTYVAAAFCNDGFKAFSGWTIQEEVVTGIKSYTANFQEYTPSESDGYYFAGQLVDLNSREQIAGAEVSWVNTEQKGVYITKYTNDLGFVCLKVPFNVRGSFHAIAEGYVSDYSVPQAYKINMEPSFTFAEMMTGPICSVMSNKTDATFHVHEYVNNTAIHPSFTHDAEDVYLKEIPTRMLAEGGKMVVLADDICDQYNFNHGSLCYYFIGRLPLGANLYEIVFEPDSNFTVDEWILTSGAANGTIKMEVGTEYPINMAGAPYTYTINYSDKTTVAQTGDNNIALIIGLIVVICACGGFIAYKKIRKK